jgi:GxxExxY protein
VRYIFATLRFLTAGITSSLREVFFYHGEHRGHRGLFALKKNNLHHKYVRNFLYFCKKEKDMNANNITSTIIGAAIEVHKGLGPGLMENVYESCLEYELKQSGMDIQRQLILPVNYKGISIDSGYRLDLLVENQVIVEVKSVSGLENIHSAQLLTYLKISNLKLGLLINFNSVKLTQGIKRFINDI